MGFAEDYAKWLPMARDKGAKYLLFVRDTFDYTHYPVLAFDDQDLETQYLRHSKNMQEVIEIVNVDTGKFFNWFSSEDRSDQPPPIPSPGPSQLRRPKPSRGIKKPSRKPRRSKRIMHAKRAKQMG